MYWLQSNTIPATLVAIESIEYLHAAMLAEQLVMPIGLVNVISQVIFAAGERKIDESGSNEAQTKFDTIGTIAFAGSVREVQIRFVF